MAGLAESVSVHVRSAVARAGVAAQKHIRAFAGGARVGGERSTGVALHIATQAVACSIHVVAICADTSSVVQAGQRSAGSALVR